MFKTIVDAVIAHAEKQPDRPFCIFESDKRQARLTFGDLFRRSSAVAAYLKRAGVRRGDVVLLFLDQSEQIFPCFIGVQMVGAIPSLMPLPSDKQHPSIYWSAHNALFKRVNPRAVVCEDRFAAALGELQSEQSFSVIRMADIATAGDEGFDFEAWREASSGDIALLQHSSGTTALKKGVMLSHAAIIAHVESYSAALELDTETDIIASWLPYYHDMGLIACFMLPVITGMTVVLQDPFEWAARPLTLLDSIERHRATLCWLPNFAFEHLARARLKKTYDLSSMRAFVNCSEPCKLDSFKRFAEKFAECGVTANMLQTCYASAETVFAVSQTAVGARAQSVKIDRAELEANSAVVVSGGDANSLEVISCGKPIGGIEVAIVDDKQAPLPAGRAGEIAVRGSAIFDGYYHLPEETKQRVVDGWYLSRDLGFFHNGELYVLGRKDDLIIVNGKNLFAHDVEYLVSNVPEIKAGRSVAFGFFSADLGSEEVVIVAELKREIDTDGRLLQRQVKQLVLDHAGIVPRDVLIVEEGWLVKTTSGKISRSLNREKYRVERFGPRPKE